MSPDASEPREPALTVSGVSLSDVVESGGPFGSLFIGPGDGLRERAQFAIDTVPIPAPHAGKLLSGVEDSQARSQVVISNGSDVWRFLLEDPLAFDLARFGDIPSLGPVIEAAQVTAPHVVVTIEDDVFGLTSFGAVDSAPVPGTDGLVPLSELSILEARDHLIDALGSSRVRLVALVGTEDAIAGIRTDLQTALPMVRFNAYPTDDIDKDLLSIADDVVRDAAAWAAESRTHELAHFRQARTAAQAREGAAAVGSLQAGEAQRLLVHDDLAQVADAGVTRLVDRAIVAAIRAGVPITIIPSVPEDRGPRDGLGVIVRGFGVVVTNTTADRSSPENVSIDAGKIAGRS